MGGIADAVDGKDEGVAPVIVDMLEVGFPKLKPVNNGCSVGAGKANSSGCRPPSDPAGVEATCPNLSGG